MVLQSNGRTIAINLSECTLKRLDAQWKKIKNVFMDTHLFTFEGELRGMSPTYVDVSVASRDKLYLKTDTAYLNIDLKIRFHDNGTADIKLNGDPAIAKDWSDAFTLALTVMLTNISVRTKLLAAKRKELRSMINKITPPGSIERVLTNIDLNSLLLT